MAQSTPSGEGSGSERGWMYVRLTWKWVAWGVAALVALIIVVDRSEDWLSHVSYPFNTWRMDLDDAIGNVIAFLAVLVAYLAVTRRQKATESKLNGGLEELAKKLMRDEIETAGLNQTYMELLARVEKCMKENADMRQFILDRFGEEMPDGPVS